MKRSVEVITVDTDESSSKVNREPFVFYVEEITRCELNGSYIVRGMWLSRDDYTRKDILGKELDKVNNPESDRRFLSEYESIQGIFEQKLVPSLFNLSENLKKASLFCPDSDISQIFPHYFNPHIVLHD